MSTPARIRKALNALEMRRVAIERQIIADMERKFFSAPPEAIVSISATSVLPAPGLTMGLDAATTTKSQFTMTWLG